MLLEQEVPPRRLPSSMSLSLTTIFTLRGSNKGKFVGNLLLALSKAPPTAPLDHIQTSR